MFNYLEYSSVTSPEVFFSWLMGFKNKKLTLNGVSKKNNVKY